MEINAAQQMRVKRYTLPSLQTASWTHSLLDKYAASAIHVLELSLKHNKCVKIWS